MADYTAEKMEVAVPETLAIKASGVTIGEMRMFGENPDLYICSEFSQKFDLITFQLMMYRYWQDQGREVEQCIVDFEGSAIWLYLKKKGATPRGN